MNMPRLSVALFSFMLSIGEIPDAQAALFSISFYEETGDINSADPGPGLNNFFDDYTFTGGGTFEILNTAIGPDGLVPFGSGDFLNFSISISLFDDPLVTGADGASFTLGVDDFQLGEPEERGLLFDDTGTPLQFRVVGSGAASSKTMCTGPSDPSTSCEGVTLNNQTNLVLIQNTSFEEIFLTGTGEVTTVSANMNPVLPFTQFAGDWTYFQGVNVGGEGITKNGYYTVNAIPVPAAIWLFVSGLLGLVSISRAHGRS